MIQTVLTVVAEVEPASEDVLRKRILAMRERVKQGDEPFEWFRAAVPSLHFMSLTVFPDDQYDPILVLETNFDGPPGPFWAQVEAAVGEDLRDMLRCCKVPRDLDRNLFQAVTAEGSRVPVAPLLEARTVWPLVFHVGNRGLDRARILAEGKLFEAVQGVLGDGGAFKGHRAADVHRDLRARLIAHPDFRWLGEQAPPRIASLESALDYVKFGAVIVAGVALLIALFAPGLRLGQFVVNPIWPAALRLALPGVMAVGGAVFFVACLLGWVRWLEERDPSHDAPKLDEDVMRAMARREDFFAQNHMISIVHVKPGVLRAVIVRVAMRALGLVLRVFARDGYLSSMRTIHFAHWALVSNGGRLMFHSNFDGSWESYLDDFIEKAHKGLTLAWSGGVGFPPTKFLQNEGATHGRQFKAWARHSMVESQFWFSAYPQYSVNQIERQARIADGLRRPGISEGEAASWAKDL